MLRAAYGHSATQVAAFLGALLGLPGVQTQAPEQVANALNAYEKGLDFADALHVLLSQEATTFYSFDTVLR